MIAAKRPSHSLENRSDEYITAYYEAITNEPQQEAKPSSLGSFVGADVRSDACSPSMIEKARKDMMKRYQDMWKQPLGRSLNKEMEK